MLSGSIDKDDSELRRDLETLAALDAIPTLDPFLLWEQLQRNGIRPAECNFQITEADIQRMLFLAENEISDLVRLAVGGEGTAEQAGVITKKLLSSRGAEQTEGLRMVLQMDPGQYREGIFCWKAFIYYKWRLRELLPKAQKVIQEIAHVVPRGSPTADEKVEIGEMRHNISRSFTAAVKSVSATLAIYDNAFQMLTQKSDPLVFKNCLLSAP
ncbi:MAG: hypothetical protein RJA87_859 [Pseudomonadota bacterium]|jgi:hypothetical protein